MPRGLRDLIAYGLSYSAQLDAYLFLLTDVYPDSNPLTALAELPSREDPIELQVRGEPAALAPDRVLSSAARDPAPDLANPVGDRSRRLAVIANWFATLIAGASPPALHGFLAAYVRYRTHVLAYLFLIADPFPGFTGQPGSYPIDPRIAGPVAQNRWKVFFRGLLALPAILLNSAYGALLLVVALLGWFACLATGQMPLGMRNAGALALRYAAQTNGYIMLLTEAYPYSGPLAPASAAPAPSAMAEPLPEPAL